MGRGPSNAFICLFKLIMNYEVFKRLALLHIQFQVMSIQLKLLLFTFGNVILCLLDRNWF